jgi:hypothetical protein
LDKLGLTKGKDDIQTGVHTTKKDAYPEWVEKDDQADKRQHV